MSGPIHTSTGAAPRAQTLLSNWSFSKRLFWFRCGLRCRSYVFGFVCAVLLWCVLGLGASGRVGAARVGTQNQPKGKPIHSLQACCEFWKVFGALKGSAGCFEIVHGPQEQGVRCVFCNVNAWSCKRFAGAGMLGLFEILV